MEFNDFFVDLCDWLKIFMRKSKLASWPIRRVGSHDFHLFATGLSPVANFSRASQRLRALRASCNRFVALFWRRIDGFSFAPKTVIRKLFKTEKYSIFHSQSKPPSQLKAKS